MPYFLLLLLIIHIMFLLQVFIWSIYFIMTLVKQVSVMQHNSLIKKQRSKYLVTAKRVLFP